MGGVRSGVVRASLRGAAVFGQADGPPRTLNPGVTRMADCATEAEPARRLTVPPRGCRSRALAHGATQGRHPDGDRAGRRRTLHEARSARHPSRQDIARAAGVAPRTFYRYFACKEECLAPLFSAGVEKWAEAGLRPGRPVRAGALRHAVVQTLTPGVGVRPESMDWVRALLRLAEGSPALLRVWGEACRGAEPDAGAGTRRRGSSATGGGAEFRLGAAVAGAGGSRGGGGLGRR